jgi:hypothetical protein
MLIVLSVAMALAAGTLTQRHRRRRWAARDDAMSRVFRRREFVALDTHLEAVAQEEHRRLDDELARYLAGRAGYVVDVSTTRRGTALQLSDGRRLALRGVSCRSLELLGRRSKQDLLRPWSFGRGPLSCRLMLRGPAGAEVEIYARNAALHASAPDADGPP